MVGTDSVITKVSRKHGPVSVAPGSQLLFVWSGVTWLSDDDSVNLANETNLTFFSFSSLALQTDVDALYSIALDYGGRHLLPAQSAQSCDPCHGARSGGQFLLRGVKEHILYIACDHEFDIIDRKIELPTHTLFVGSLLPLFVGS